MVTLNEAEGLSKLHQLMKQGIITEEDFERQRKRLLRSKLNVLDVAKSITELIKVAALPIVVIVLVVAFGDIVRERLSKSEEIRFASFYLKVRERAVGQGNPQIAEAIGRLSRDALMQLLNLGTSRHAVVSRDTDETILSLYEYAFLTYRELEEAGLLIASEPLDEFWRFFKSLNPIEKTQYKARDEAKYTAEKSDRFPIRSKFYQLESRSLADGAIKRILDFDVYLSEEGRRAFLLIVETVGDQIVADS
jgi:hypothetical protein